MFSNNNIKTGLTYIAEAIFSQGASKSERDSSVSHVLSLFQNEFIGH